MNLTPLFDRIIVKPTKRKEQTVGKSGILITSDYEKTEEIHAEVLAVGTEVVHVKVGNMVSVPAYGYDTVSDETGEYNDLIAVRERDVLAIIKPTI